eukprot:gene3817-4405_t
MSAPNAPKKKKQVDECFIDAFGWHVFIRGVINEVVSTFLLLFTIRFLKGDYLWHASAVKLPTGQLDTSNQHYTFFGAFIDLVIVVGAATVINGRSLIVKIRHQFENQVTSSLSTSQTTYTSLTSSTRPTYRANIIEAGIKEEFGDVIPAAWYGMYKDQTMSVIMETLFFSSFFILFTTVSAYQRSLYAALPLAPLTNDTHQLLAQYMTDSKVGMISFDFAFNYLQMLIINQVSRVDEEKLFSFPKKFTKLYRSTKNEGLIGRMLYFPLKLIIEQSNDQEQQGRKKVGKWLLFTAGLVGAMVVVGGITRLTESGLSMVDWKPIVGAIPPLNQQEWIEEFAKYQQYPEFKKTNNKMTVEEFKEIFFWEYSHRLFGRVLGLVFFFPFVYYAKKGYIDRRLGAKLSGIFMLGGAQGALGWYMVKSGLEEKLMDVGEVARVSQYRLAAHLGSAFVIYTSLLWIGLDLVSPGLSNSVRTALKDAPARMQANARRVVKAAPITAGLIFVTAMSGAFVAGLDAGLVHNTFPKMSGEWVPHDLINPRVQPAWKNMFEHDVTVQFQHRILATITYGTILGLTAVAYRGRRALTPRARMAAYSLAVMGTAQVILGISTLLTFVPVSLGASHQAGSLTLLSVAIWLLHELKRLPK